MITAMQIIKEYLESNGYDGLTSGDCGCLLDDIEPCVGIMDCVAGHKVMGCSGECSGNCLWHIVPGKEKT